MQDRVKGNAAKPVQGSPAGLLTGLSGKLAELEQAVSRQGERFAAVLEIGTMVSSATSIDELLRVVIERLTALLGAEAATLFMLDVQTDELWSRVLRGSTLKEIRVPAQKGIVGHVVTTGQALVTGDAYSDVRFNPDVDRKSGFRTRSVIAAPLRHVSGRILGALEVLDRKVNAFTTEDRALVEAVASQIAAVLENVLLLDQLRTQNEQLKRAKEDLSQAVLDLDLLYDVERAVSSAEKQDELLDSILEKATSVIGCGAGSILLSNEDYDALFFRSARGEKSEALVSVQLKAGQGIAGHVAQTGETIRVAEAEESEHYDKSVAKKLGVQVRSVLCVPIPGEDHILGSLELLNKPGGFSEGDERLATLLAGQAGRAILLRRNREEGEREARLAAIGKGLSGVLHDLRTPMTIISGYVQLMSSETDEKLRGEYAQIVEKQFEHIGAMTRETLAFARGEKELLVRKIYLQKFAEEVEGYLRKDFERTTVELVMDVRFKGVVRADENKLKRVVYNIARNAVQAMEEGGKFTFTIDKDGSELLFRFTDTGPGIPEEIADKLFQSFVTAGKKNGTGLGLAIVKQIAEEHGGGVTFKTKAGKGTTFEVRIPTNA